MKLSRLSFVLCAALVPAVFLVQAAGTGKGEPPNEPARTSYESGRLILRYDGQILFSADVAAGPEGLSIKENSAERDGKISQVILMTSKDFRSLVKISGLVSAGPEAFACEAERRDKGPALVRHSSGPSHSLLNRAVYDRGADWLLSIDAGPKVGLKPAGGGGSGLPFVLKAEGSEIVLRFQPRYYQKHRGLSFFEPWTYKTWPGSVAGWISWFAFLDKITEQDVLETADVLSEVLLPFGYDILQIDDGYQRGEGLPELWLQANSKFPRGLGFLAEAVKKKGLVPGIWTNAAFKQADFAASHRDWFVLDEKGNPARGNWVAYSLDGSNDSALEAVVRPVYRGLRDMGWGYFKVDALRHLRYEGYNAHAGHFARKKADLVAAYRAYVQAVRREIGRDAFLLGCWGIRPELTGLIDGCRIGTDGFSYAGLAQFNSWNNVVWRNDPDHIELNSDRYRSLTVTTLTGSLLLLTDKPGLYRTPAAEAAKRAAPVLQTLPGQVYDLDPSRSANLGRVDTEVSGSGPRVFDASLEPSCDLFLLEINRPFESWAILGRTGERVPEIRFSDLGLDHSREYFVFEFWTKQLLGSFTGSFRPGPLDSSLRCQALCLRERKTYPQLIATSRHVTCGGVDLEDVRWEDESLKGRSRIVGGDPYDLYLTEPPGYRLDGVDCEGAVCEKPVRENGLVRLRLVSMVSRIVSWTAGYSRVGSSS